MKNLKARTTALSLMLFTACLVSPTQVQASENIEFNAISFPLSKFKIKRLKAKGIKDPQPEPGPKLSGTLTLPAGDGPFPAVILNHDCRGIRPYQSALAKKLVSWGYATFMLDSYTARKVPVKQVCANIAKWDTKDFIGGRTLDVYGALKMLKANSKIDADKLHLIGWDRDTTMSSVARQGISQTFADLKPKSAISIYPDCRRLSSGEFASPIMIIAAKNDDWWPAKNCTKLEKAAAKSDGAKVSLEIYDAAHGFDDPQVGEKTILADAFNPNKSPTRGATFSYNKSAADQLEQRIKSYLKSN